MKNEPDCCFVEAVISIDQRGQMVLPKELRAKAGIKAGEKLALTSFYKNGEICCITITKAIDLAEQVKNNLGNTLKNII
jgi:AbrB family looped-hinge helix DNA binding protein